MSYRPYNPPSKEEYRIRLNRLFERLSAKAPDWDTAFVCGRLNLYYFCGTMQDGALILRKDGESTLFVRRSLDRALDESPFPDILPMRSFREVAEKIGANCGYALLETELLPVGHVERMKKYLNFDSISSLEPHIGALRAVKSAYELSIMEESGRQHQKLFETEIPEILYEGISEYEFMAALYPRMMKLGYQGVTRFVMFQNETVAGQYGFGENSLYPTSFDGPGGMRGLSPVIASIGSGERRLKKGDLAFIDIAFGIDGYHTDKTQVYSFGAEPSAQAQKAHRRCMDIIEAAAALMVPGAIPDEIYRKAVPLEDKEFMQNFMGFGGKTVGFLGHGIGLVVDELPIIAPGFHIPLEAGMTIALEPKKGIEGQGMVGPEETYVVTETGGRCLTGGGREIIQL